MGRVFPTLILAGLLLGLHQPVGGNPQLCGQQTTCRGCITASAECSWCSNPNGTSCAPRGVTAARCPAELIEDPMSRVVTSNPPQNITGPITPQVINIALRPGETVNFNFLVNTPDENPLDIYFLMDVSGSLSDDIANLRELSSNLTILLKGLTTSLHLGMGSFVDKPILPYTTEIIKNYFGFCLNGLDECAPAYSYRHLLSLTPNTTLFQNTLDSHLNLSHGADSPEGGFDALLQAAVCTDLIGWRSKAQRLLILMTDAPPHIAGDGKVAGILTPNDGLCHMSVPAAGGNFPEYSHWNELDYPSVSQLREVLAQQQITPIFATTGSARPTYLEIQKQLPQSLVGVFDGNNIAFINLIESEVRDAIVRQVVRIEGEDTDGYQIRQIAIGGCGSKTTEGYCEVQPGQAVSYHYTVTAETCQEKKDFSINVFGLGSVQVSVETLCQCACDDAPVLNHPSCSNGRGSLICGDCSCSNLTVEYQCPMSNSIACSGHGICSGCGECLCDSLPDGREYYGDACEFDNTCVRDQNGAFCGGRGNCSDSQCDCVKSTLTGLPFTGDMCDCSPDNDSCINPELPQRGLCSNDGRCSCNRCQCDTDFGGLYCEQCLTSSCLSCEASRSCVLCAKGLIDAPCDNCTTRLRLQDFHSNTQAELNMTYADQELLMCGTIVDEEECLHEYYTAEHPVTGVVTIIANRGRQCFIDPVPWIVLAVIFVAVFSIGLVILLVIKCVIMYLDYQEVKRLEEEARLSEWSRQLNPLYVSPTKEYPNIAYQLRQKKKKEEEEIRRVSAFITNFDDLDALFPELPKQEPRTMHTSTSMPTMQLVVPESSPAVRIRPSSAAPNRTMTSNSSYPMMPVDKKFMVDHRDNLETVLELDAIGSDREQREVRVYEEEDDISSNQRARKLKEENQQSDSEECDGEEEVVEDICWQYPTGPAAAELPSSYNGLSIPEIKLSLEPMLSDEQHTELQAVAPVYKQQELSSERQLDPADSTEETQLESHYRLALHSPPNHYETTL